ncbi:MAG: DUF86 domain-containing protein [Terracidiphilus sp.]
MKREDLGAKDFLLHMLEAADRILQYTAGMSREQFLANPLVQDAVTRNIEIIGEAANNLVEVGPDYTVRYPSIPFAQIYGMRNRVSHGYFAVSLPMIWDTVEFDVPDLRQKIAAVLAELAENG